MNSSRPCHAVPFRSALRVQPCNRLPSAHTHLVSEPPLIIDTLLQKPSHHIIAGHTDELRTLTGSRATPDTPFLHNTPT